MKRIGLLSDTHGFLDTGLHKHFENVDEIWHAGDIGDESLLIQLRLWKPLRAVFGNIDSTAVRAELTENLWLEMEGVKILMTHIGGAPPHYNPRIRNLLKKEIPHVFICGHSHILKVMKDANYSNMFYINPGASGNHGFHRMKTAIRFELADRTIRKLEVIELGRRGAIN